MARSKAGFSLVELMIVVAIIGILAAIAVPNFVTMQLKSKRAELPGNLEGVKRTMVAYDAAYDGFFAVAVQPRADAALDKDQAAWGTSYTDWASLGWDPDGRVRGNYAVTLVSGPPESFIAVARSDVDDDANLAEFTATVQDNVTATPSAMAYY